MSGKEVLDIIRGAIRPYLAFAFPTAVLVIGIIAAVRFLDRDLANTIIVGIITASTAIIAFYFGERAAKPKSEK